MKAQRVLVGLIASSLVAASAEATYLPASPGSQLILNFTLTAPPAPPYELLDFDLQTYTTLNPTGPVYIASYGSLNGSDLVDSRSVPDFFWETGRLQFSNANPILWERLNDGQFSIGLYTDGAQVDMKSLSYRGGIFVNGVYETTERQLYSFAASVPEPSTYALMLAGLGLVGFAAGRCKRA